MYNCQHLSLNLLDADVHSAALSDSPSPHAPSPSVSCLAQEEGKGISLAPGSAARQPEPWKGSVACSRSPLALTPSKPGRPSLQNGDGLQRGTAYLLVQGGQSCSQGSPASLLPSSHSKHFKSFPLLLKEKPSSLPRPHVTWPRLPHIEPFPSLVALTVSQLSAPFSALTLPACPSLRMFAHTPASTWTALTSCSSHGCLLLILQLSHKCHHLREAFLDFPIERKPLSLFSIQHLFEPSYPYTFAC